VLSAPVRLHLYCTHQIRARVYPLADLARRHRRTLSAWTAPAIPAGLASQNVPIGARVLAAAETWAERACGGPTDLTGDAGLDPPAPLPGSPAPSPAPGASVSAPGRLPLLRP
jgi:hypothetical protein